jgi:hypothetical protein
MSITEELLNLVPAAEQLIEYLLNGNLDEANHKAKAVSQALALKLATREAAKLDP